MYIASAKRAIAGLCTQIATFVAPIPVEEVQRPVAVRATPNPQRAYLREWAGWEHQFSE